MITYPPSIDCLPSARLSIIYIFKFFSIRTAWWILMTLGWDEYVCPLTSLVFCLLHKELDPRRTKIGQEGLLLWQVSLDQKDSETEYLAMIWKKSIFSIPKSNFWCWFWGVVLDWVIFAQFRYTSVGIYVVSKCQICITFYFSIYKDKKEEIWPSPMTKAPTPTEMSKGQSHNTNNATKKFD